MTLESKKALVYQFIQTGLELNKAMVLAQIEPEEIVLLKNDKHFMQRVEFYTCHMEHELLETLNRIAEENAAKGISTEVRWKLERVNPERWATGGKVRIAVSQDSNVLPQMVIGKESQGDDE